MRRVALIRIVALIATAAVPWFGCSSPEPQDAIVIPLDTRYANTPEVAPVLGMYIIDRPAFDLHFTDPTKDTVTNGDIDLYWDKLPFILVYAAWSDGHMVWASDLDRTNYSVSQGSTTPEAIAGVRDQLLAMIDGLTLMRPVPLDSEETHIVLFAKSGEKYKVIVAALEVAEPDHFRARPNDPAVLQPTVVDFRKKWAAARAVVMGSTPKVPDTERADWFVFARIPN